MIIEITPHFISLTYEAALKSFWRREALRKFLRECHVSESSLSTWAQEESKRDFLDRIFTALQKTENGKKTIQKMAQFLAEQITFPDLRNWEDSEKKISEAAKAVSDLKAFIYKKTEEIINQKEIEEAKLRARKEKELIQRAQTDLSKLSQALNDLLPFQGTQNGGYRFQDWFYDFINFSEIDSRRPYNISGRQIDGSLTIDGTTYLIELKFTSEQAVAPDIDIFKSKVESKADNTMGIFVSMSGYSSVAISEASGKRTVLLLLDATHLFLSLSGIMNIKEVIRRVRRHASQTGEAYLATNCFNG